MCIICAELAKGKLTSLEARRNFTEMKSSLNDEHRLEVLQRIWKKEDEEDYYNSYNDYEGNTD
tara:strand:- start:137 stop:325 length:189 start_codon:yes stop_codon:yes gene_type:complete